MTYINLNGKIVPAEAAMLPHDNRAFRYGYGLFETMLLQNGAIALSHYHWERLFSGLQQLHFRLPHAFTPQWLESEIYRTAEKNKLLKFCRVRLQVYAGSGGLYDTRDDKAGFIIECFPIDEHISSLNENGLVIGVASGLQKSNDSLANLKTTNALIYAMAAQQVRDNKWNDALICNTDGHLIESTIANIFWIKDNIIYTPPLKDGCIAGVMRRYIIERLKDTPYRIAESSLTIAALLQADELFVTNAIRKIKWVRAIDSRNNFSCSFINQMLKFL